MKKQYSPESSVTPVTAVSGRPPSSSSSPPSAVANPMRCPPFVGLYGASTWGWWQEQGAQQAIPWAQETEPSKAKSKSSVTFCVKMQINFSGHFSLSLSLYFPSASSAIYQIQGHSCAHCRQKRETWLNAFPVKGTQQQPTTPVLPLGACESDDRAAQGYLRSPRQMARGCQKWNGV